MMGISECGHKLFTSWSRCGLIAAYAPPWFGWRAKTRINTSASSHVRCWLNYLRLIERVRKAFVKFAIFVTLAALPAVAQQSRVFREGDSWVEEITGSLPAVRNLRLSTDVGAVRVQGGNQNSINYVIRKCINAS